MLTAVATAVSAQSNPCPEERQRAAAVRERIERDWPLRGYDAVTRYIDDFGYGLAQGAGIAGVSRWRFRVVQDTSINAYSIGDGQIYITEGAIVAAANEAQLAAILAHEMGHDIAGHLCPRSERDEEKPDWDVFSPAAPAPAHPRAESFYGTLRQVIDPEKEREANRNAAVILRKAGYDPAAIRRIAQRIMQRERANGRSGARSHLSYGASESPRYQQYYPPPAAARPGAELMVIQQILHDDHR